MTTRRSAWRTMMAVAAGVLVTGLTAGPHARAADAKPAATTPATAPAADGPAIEATDKAALAAATGKDVTVTGTVSKAEWSKSGKVMNVEFADSELVLAVFERTKADVDAAFEGDAAKAWSGAKVKVTGKLAKYGGKAKENEGRPQIVVSKPAQVTVVEKAAAK